MKIEELIKGCKENNPRAQNKLYEMFHKSLIATGLKYSNNADDVEDVVQDCFIKIFNEIHKFKGDTKNGLEGWMRAIVRNKVIDLYRKNKNINKVEIKDDFFSEDDEVYFYDMFLNHVPTIIEKLSPQYKKVVSLYYLEDKSHEEIANILGISTGSSKSNLFKSKINMKKTLLSLQPID
jgi:RNA polymerase sigma-70 factor (ECF subfamily)